MQMQLGGIKEEVEVEERGENRRRAKVEAGLDWDEDIEMIVQGIMCPWLQASKVRTIGWWSDALVSVSTEIYSMQSANSSQTKKKSRQ